MKTTEECDIIHAGESSAAIHSWDEVSKGAEVNSIAYWYPKIAGRVPTPKTDIISCAKCDFIIQKTLCGEELQEDENRLLSSFFGEIEKAANALGWHDCREVFMRSGHTSGKHNWEEGPHLPPGAQISSHVLAIAEYAILTSFIGLPLDVWAVREHLDIEVLAFVPGYRGMPITWEWRFFIVDGEFQCWHHYWPKRALTIGGIPDDDADRIIASFTEPPDEAFDMAEMAARRFGFDASVDIIKDANGKLFVTDMATYGSSFHDYGCKFVEAEKEKQNVEE